MISERSLAVSSGRFRLLYFSGTRASLFTRGEQTFQPITALRCFGYGYSVPAVGSVGGEGDVQGEFAVIGLIGYTKFYEGLKGDRAVVLLAVNSLAERFWM